MDVRRPEEYVIPEQAVEVAQTRMACPALAGIDRTESGDSESQDGSATASGGDGGDQNAAHRLVSRFGLAEVWMWTVLVLAAWSAMV